LRRPAVVPHPATAGPQGGLTACFIAMKMLGFGRSRIMMLAD